MMAYNFFEFKISRVAIKKIKEKINERTIYEAHEVYKGSFMIIWENEGKIKKSFYTKKEVEENFKSGLWVLS